MPEEEPLLYRVETGRYEQEPQERVNAFVQQGWRPLGGVSVSVYDAGILFVQALVWEEKERNSE